MNHSATAYIPPQSGTIPPTLLTLPQEDNKASLRVRFNALLLGYLALNSFTDDPRWITVVTSQAIDRQSYKSMFGDKSRLRIIQAKTEDLLWITWQCLAQGNSYAVISTMETTSTEQQQQFLEAAAIGNCTFHEV